MDRTLVIVRHGQSEWNLLNLFTGWRDVDLSAKGIDNDESLLEEPLSGLHISLQLRRETTKLPSASMARYR